jgi:hypothetical protein
MLAPARVACAARASFAPSRCQLRAAPAGRSAAALALSRPRAAPARALRHAAMAAAAAKRVLVPIGNGSEARTPPSSAARASCADNSLGSQEIEAVSIVDVLRRAGADVTLASVEEGLTCTMSRGVKIQARTRTHAHAHAHMQQAL